MTSSLWFVIARDLTNIGNDLANLTSDLAQITTTIQVLLSTQQEPPSNILLNPDQSQASTSQQPNFNFMPTVPNFSASYFQPSHDVNSQFNPASIYSGMRTPYAHYDQNQNSHSQPSTTTNQTVSSSLHHLQLLIDQLDPSRFIPTNRAFLPERQIQSNTFPEVR